MSYSIDLQLSLNVSEDGNSLKRNVALQAHLLDQLERVLDAEVQLINRGSTMREVHDLASGMKAAIDSIKKSSADAKSALGVEISRAATNASKVQSLAADLKSANLEVEDFLGESNSNFSPSEEETSSTPTSATLPKATIAPKTDINGVTLNPEAPR